MQTEAPQPAEAEATEPVQESTELMPIQVPSSDLAPAPAAAGAPGGEVATLWNTHDPQSIVLQASAVATALADVIEKQELARNLGGRKKHVEIEGWQTAGTLLGAQALTTDTKRVEPRCEFPVKTHGKKYGYVNGKRQIVEEYTDEWTCTGWSYDAVAEVRTLDGRCIGRGEATCSREEDNWMRASDSAVKGMAQTRACSRALRQALGFIVGMAGYSATPQEEMEAAGASPDLEPATEEQKEQLRVALQYLVEPAGETVWGEIKEAFGGDLYGPAVEAVCAVIRARREIDQADAGGASSA
jgi:hypothetical protein